MWRLGISDHSTRGKYRTKRLLSNATIAMPDSYWSMKWARRKEIAALVEHSKREEFDHVTDFFRLPELPPHWLPARSHTYFLGSETADGA